MADSVTDRVLKGDVTDRVEYFDHQFLRAPDFEDMVAYTLDRRWRHNRDFHLTGIVGGLTVDATGLPGSITVSEGWAVDSSGRELVLPVSTKLDVSGSGDVWISWQETVSHRSVDPGVAGTPDRTSEIPALSVGTDPGRGVKLGTLSSEGFDSSSRQEVGQFIGTKDLQNGAVTEPKIADGAVTTNKLANSAVTQQKLANAAVGTDQLIDANVTQAKLAAAAVGSAQLADQSVLQTKLAADSVGTAQLIDLNVTQGKLAAGAVGTTQLAASAVTQAQLADGAVATSKLADQSVTQPKLALLVVGTPQLVDQAVTQQKLANNAVGTAQLANQAVTQTQIAPAIVSFTELKTFVVVSGTFSVPASGTQAVFLGQARPGPPQNILYIPNVTSISVLGSPIEVSFQFTNVFALFGGTFVQRFLFLRNLTANALSVDVTVTALAAS